VIDDDIDISSEEVATEVPVRRRLSFDSYSEDSFVVTDDLEYFDSDDSYEHDDSVVIVDEQSYDSDEDLDPDWSWE